MELKGLVRLAALAGAAIFASGCAAQSQGSLPAAATMHRGKSQYLLYVDTGGRGVDVYAYPGLKRLGALNGFDKSITLAGLCSDNNGDVFVTGWFSITGTGFVYEFEHGGTTPIATLRDPAAASSCAVDPITGNLAVTNSESLQHSSGSVAIYANAQGTPVIYTDPNITSYAFDAYDDGGNLYVDGKESASPELAVLPIGSSTFTDIGLQDRIYISSLQWLDGSLMIASNDCYCHSGSTTINQVQITGNVGTIVGTTTLNSKGKNNFDSQFWILGDTIVGPGRKKFLQVWSYPSGGNAINRVGQVLSAGLTVSVAPSR